MDESENSSFPHEVSFLYYCFDQISSPLDLIIHLSLVKTLSLLDSALRISWCNLQLMNKLIYIPLIGTLQQTFCCDGDFVDIWVHSSPCSWKSQKHRMPHCYGDCPEDHWLYKSSERMLHLLHLCLQGLNNEQGLF